MRHDDTRDLDFLKADIESRLRNACAHFPPGEFAALVHQIASIELKYAQQTSLSGADEKP